MVKRFVGASICIALASLAAHAQSAAFETCTPRSACNILVTENLDRARSIFAGGHHREASQYLYPILLAENRNITTTSRARAATLFSEILADAGLFGHAAMQARAGNRLTSAPASAGLLKEARLLARAGLEEEAAIAYARAEAIATEAANLDTIDGLVQDFTAMGQTVRADTLRVARRDIAARFDRICSAARCRSAPLVQAQMQSQESPDFPAEALRSNRSGTCRVTLNVTETGTGTDFSAECTDTVFEASALESARSATFTPRFQDGAPEPEYGVVLPIEFAVR